jgi:hypothetical protein
MADYNGDLNVVISQQATLIKKVDGLVEKVDPVCDMVIRHDEKIATNDKEIEKLRKKSDIWNSLNSLGVMVSAAFSAWKGG